MYLNLSCILLNYSIAMYLVISLSVIRVTRYVSVTNARVSVCSIVHGHGHCESLAFRKEKRLRVTTKVFCDLLNFTKGCFIALYFLEIIKAWCGTLQP